MKKLINPCILLLCCLSLLFSGCSKTVDEEITSLNFSRLLSPSGVTATVVNRTSVRLNWNKVAKAETYTIEFFNNDTMDFSGTPVRTVQGVEPDAMPYTVPGLVGETAYSVRIKAVGQGIEDSKWSAATFTTDAEQIFLLRCKLRRSNFSKLVFSLLARLSRSCSGKTLRRSE